MKKKKIVITIDGPGGCGKSSTAKALAKKLGYTYINTGTFYKAVAYNVLKNNIKIDDNEKIIYATKKIDINYQIDKIFVDNEEISNQLFLPRVVNVTSIIAQIPEIRKILLPLQRKCGENRNIVVEGRDAGTVVFPDANFKFYLDASFSVRVQRILKLLPEHEKKKYKNNNSLAHYVKQWDEKDADKIKLLKKKKDVIIYNNTDSPSAEQDATVLAYYISNKREIVKNVDLIKKWLNQ